MATAVQIELRVDEQGAIQGVRAFDTAVKGSAGSVRQLNSELQAVGTRATAAGRHAKAGIDQVGKSALTSREQVRLLSEEIGIRIPRAMQSVISKSPAVATALRSITGLMIGLGAVQIGGMVFAQLYDGAKKLWNEHLSLTKAAQDYNAELEKTRNENFGDSHSIETTRLRIDEAAQAAINFRQQAESAQRATIGWRSALDAIAPGAGTVWQALHGRSQASDLTKQQYDQQRLKDRLADVREGEQYHTEISGDDEEVAASAQADPRLTKLQKRNAELQKTLLLDAEDRRYQNEQDRILGNSVAPDAGKAEQDQKDHIARLQMQAEEANEEKENAQELRHIHEEALESGLRGSALYHEQEAAAINDLKQKGIASARAVADTRVKFHNEEMKRLEDEGREADKTLRAAQASGMTGAAKINFERQGKIQDISASGPEDPVARMKLYAAANAEADQQILTAQQSFTERTAQLADQNAERQSAGFARIRASAEKEIGAARQEFEKLYSTPELQQSHAGILNARIGAINAGADQDSSELARRNADETAQIEMEAHARSMSAEKQQTAAIQAEYEARLQKYNEELKQQEISQDDFNRRVVAAEEERDAQMVEAAKAARDKMAGEFSQFFKNPTQALKELGDKAAGEAAASLVQRVQGHIGGGQNGAHGAPGGGLLDSLFAKISGAPRGGTPQKAEVEGRGVGAPSMLSLSTAQIHINSASIAFGGASSASGTRTAYSGAASFGRTGSTYEMGTGALTDSGGTSSLGHFGPGGTSGFAGPIGFSSAGGAGDVGYSPSATPGITGGPGAAMPQSNTLNNAVNDVGEGIAFGKQAASIFAGGGSSTGSGAGLATTTSGNGGADSISPEQMQNLPLGGLAKTPQNPGMLGGGGIGANIGGAASGALGLYAAVEGNGGFGGALQGGMAGMQLGMSLGGPIGAAIGAAGGAVLGVLGLGGKEKARVYDLRTVRPGIKNETQGYQTGSVDYTTAYSDMETLDTTAERTTKQWGPAAHSYYNDTIRNEIHQAEGQFTAMEKSGRSQFTASAAQYAIGTDSVPRTGLALIHQNERIFPSDKNERITRAMESLSSPEAVARGYRSAMTGGNSRASSTTEIHHHYHNHAIDAKSGAQWIMSQKHVLRSALNQSYAENSGGADAGY